MARLSWLTLALLLGAGAVRLATADDPADDVTEDPRVATVLQVEGEAYVRPTGRRRWTPLAKDAVLLPGDVVKTAARGAHALEIALASGGGVLAGPGTQVTLPERGRVQVLRGELEVKGGERPVRVEAGDLQHEVEGTAYFHSDGAVVHLLDAEPRWVHDYREATGEEWMGSLLANVDGRNVPLAVGVHQVTVDVRDQIARTTVEQTFVNSTNRRLEGVFYFPLPADASISGFGMWIGGELVEADVVEKARARQIYEDILRRKKDPGLLEWQGGNLFKARVFPIEPNSEKRIRLRYTQVLRVEGDTYRYRYALRSDLLRSKPLRKLDVRVNVLSARPMRAVASPSHLCEIENTGHEARVSFTAEEYVPTRDLEVAVTLAPSAGLTAVANRRGDEGWFMLLLTPPVAETGGWQRTLMPEGDPLELVLVADTSGSMDAAARETQQAFVGGLLALLGPDDRFQLLVADAEVQGVFDEPRAVTQASVDEALAFLSGRASLGWTDLDAAFDAALDEAGPDTLVVYVGDGVPTTGDADPAAAAARLRSLADRTQATVHAVSPSSTYEQGVLEALASIGGGSVRRADGDPAGTAYTLLAEVARPVLRNLEVAVDGVKTARLYPDPLPGLPLGSQHVLLGRFLPTDEPQRGTVTVTGDLGEEKVVFTAPLEIPAADAGNSFLPRLWARKHLDVLLAQGSSAAVQEEIVGFSAEYGIMTPYTSLLVLENDAERERYGVERRVKMRDGESYFAEARDRVALEMRRAQVRRARAWRIALRRKMQAEIRGLGRDLVPDEAVTRVVALAEKARKKAGSRGEVTAGVPVTKLRDVGADFRGLGGEAPANDAALERLETLTAENVDLAQQADHVETDNDLPFEESLGEDFAANAPMPARARRSLRSQFRGGGGGREALGRPAPPASSWSAGKRAAYESEDGEALGFLSERSYGSVDGYAERRGRRSSWSPAGRWNTYVLGFPPPLPPADVRKARPAPGWSDEVVRLLRGLDRRDALLVADGGVALRAITTTIHPVRGDALAVDAEDVLVGGGRWFHRVDPSAEERLEAWVDGTERARVHAFRRLGRKRPVLTRDARDLPDVATGVAWDAFRDTFARHEVEVVEQTEATVRIAIRGRTLLDPDRLMLIDRRRGVLVEERIVQDGRTLGRVRNTGFVEAAGLWWPRIQEVFDAEGRKTAFTTLEVEALDAAGAQARFAKATGSHDDVIFLGGADVPYEDAHRAIEDDAAGFAAWLAEVLHRAQRGHWGKAFAAWDDARENAPDDAPGATWIDVHLRAGSRFRALPEATSIAALALGEPDRAAWWAKALYEVVQSALGPNERLAFLDAARAAWTGTDDDPLVRTWWWAHAAAQQAAGDGAGARETHDAMLERWPHDLRALEQVVQDRVTLGGPAAGTPLLAERLGEGAAATYSEAERQQLYGRWTHLLWQTRALDELERVLAAWSASVPRSTEAWHHLWSLAFLRGQVDTVDADVVDVLARPVPGDFRSKEHAQLVAAVQLALGDGWQFSSRRVEDVFAEPLIDLARRLARTDVPDLALLRRITGARSLRRSDVLRRLVAGLRQDLVAADGWTTLPVRQLHAYATLLPWSKDDVEDASFARTVDGLRKRFDTLEDARARALLANTILHVLDEHHEASEAIAFLGAWVRDAKDTERAALAADLLDRILKQKHSEEREDAVFQLLPSLLDPLTPESHDRVAAVAARRVATWAYEGRRNARLPSAEARKELTRAEAREKAVAASQAARSGLVARLAAARDVVHAVFRPWLEIERLGYAVEHGGDLASTVAAARELAGGVPVGTKEALDRVLLERAVLVLAYAANRSDAPEGLADETLAWLAAREDDGSDERLDWRYEIFRLRIALDRTDGLEATLRDWMHGDEAPEGWRVALAYLLAERGRLVEAARELEVLAMNDALASAQYGTLAGWYLALGDDARREAALEGRLRAATEGELSNLVYALRSKVSRHGSDVVESLEKQDLALLTWTIRKSGRPQNYLWQLQSIYESTKDHRVLGAIAEGLPGHTPEGVYEFLQRAANLVGAVHEEATVDGALEAVDRVLAGAEAPHDRRALRLVEALLATRGALVVKTDPAFASRAIQAYDALGEGDFVPGERVHVAEVLATTAPVKQAELAVARVKLLQKLAGGSPPKSLERLRAEHALARVLWAHGEMGSAFDVLEAGLRAVRVDHRLPPGAWSVFDDYVNKLADAGRFAIAEQELLADREHDPHAARRTALTHRVFRLYAQAVARDGALSIGRGEALYTAALTAMNAYLEEAPADQAATTVAEVAALFRAAHDHGVSDDVGSDLLAWADETLAPTFDRWMLESTQLVMTVADAVKVVVSPASALHYELDRMDAEPPFFERIRRDLFSRDHWDLARWHKEAKPLQAKDASRLLTHVTRSLEEYLRSNDRTGRAFYDPDYDRFWRAKSDAFAATAHRLVELEPRNVALAERSATYLREIGRPADAIGVLEAARARGAIDAGGEERLATWLLATGRAEEALRVVDGLLERTDSFSLRLLRSKALHGVDRKDEALAVLRDAEGWLKEKRWWRDDTARDLGEHALAQGAHALAEAFLDDAVELRLRERGGRGGADGTLGRLYGLLARARVGQGKTDEAVDAASAAIVAWGRNQRQRTEAILALQEVLAKASDLDAWIETYEARVAETGLDAPVIRKALAAVFESRGAHERALEHLLVARDLAPEDAEVHQRIVAACDALGRTEEAIHALLASLRMAPRNVDAAGDLARRFAAEGDEALARRARTQLVEPLPHEAEGHRRLATIYGEQDRFDEAAAQWAQVARTDPLDPTGWLALARARLKTGEKRKAREALVHVFEGDWDRRFGDVQAEAAKLLPETKP